jgi:Tfp pilus assembly protein PilN
MTTTLTPPGSPVTAGSRPRMLTIAANLLPVEIVASRRGRKVRRIALSGLLVFALLLVGWYVAMRQPTATARSELTSAEDHAQQLVQRQRAFADVVMTQAAAQEINTQLAALLATDVQWSVLLTALQQTAPDGVRLTGVSAALTSPAAALGSTVVQLPDTSGKQSIGTLTVNGNAISNSVVAAYVDALGRLPRLGNPLLGASTLHNGKLEFTVQLDITTAALGGRYTGTSTSGSGGN